MWSFYALKIPSLTKLGTILICSSTFCFKYRSSVAKLRTQYFKETFQMKNQWCDNCPQNWSDSVSMIYVYQLFRYVSVIYNILFHSKCLIFCYFSMRENLQEKLRIAKLNWFQKLPTMCILKQIFFDWLDFYATKIILLVFQEKMQFFLYWSCILIFCHDRSFLFYDYIFCCLPNL